MVELPSLRLSVLLALSLVAACASAPPPALAPAPPSAQAPVCSAPAEAPRPPAVPASPAVTVNDPEAAIARLFTSKTLDPSWFAEAFARAVPVAKAQAIVDAMREEGGAFKGVEKTPDGFKALFERGVVPTKCGLDARGRIQMLWFAPLEATNPPPIDAVVADVRALPGKKSVLVVSDGKEVASLDADAKLAVGSSFKLAILDELRQRIDARKASWTQVIPLRGDKKSLPSGMLQDWPDGAPLTLHTLASLMISKSDNTATDLLLDFVGRASVEKLAPGNAPFLATREAFILKGKPNAALLARWRSGDEAARRKLLADDIAKAKPTLDLAAEPTALDVEWMFSARRLCELLSRNKDLDALHINPGLAKPKSWSKVAYKGGSEPGVLNFSTWVEGGGHTHCVVTTWNDEAKALDEERLARLHGLLLAGLSRPK